MNENDVMMMPYIAHESTVARLERMNKRLLIILAILIVLFFASNCVWLYAWMQYDYSSDATTTTETSTVTIDGKDGVANYIGNNGDITNGKDNSAKSEDTNNTGQNTGK